MKDNNLDGLDLVYGDDFALHAALGEHWLIACTIAIRQVLPADEYILTHSMKAAYFAGAPTFPLVGYITVNHQVG